MKHILVVDDNSLNLRAAETALSDIYRVTTVLSGARALAEDVRREMEAAVIPSEGQSIRVTVSVGVCTADRRACTIPQLVKAADQQLYAAKEAGRNRVSAVRLPDAAEGPLDVSAAGG